MNNNITFRIPNKNINNIYNPLSQTTNKSRLLNKNFVIVTIFLSCVKRCVKYPCNIQLFNININVKLFRVAFNILYLILLLIMSGQIDKNIKSIIIYIIIYIIIIILLFILLSILLFINIYIINLCNSYIRTSI